MVIAYVVDVHDRLEAVPEAIAELGAVDLLIVGGDITTGGTPDEAEAAIERWRPFGAAPAVDVDGELSVRVDGEE